MEEEGRNIDYYNRWLFLAKKNAYWDKTGSIYGNGFSINRSMGQTGNTGIFEGI